MNYPKRAEEYKHLYKTERWKKLSVSFRISHQHCVYCHEKAQCVDHKVPHKGDIKLFYDVNNLQALCFRCHNSIKSRIEHGQQPGKDFVINNEPDGNGYPTSPNHPWNSK